MLRIGRLLYIAEERWPPGFLITFIKIGMNESFSSLVGGVIGGMLAIAGVLIQGWIQRRSDREEKVCLSRLN